MNFYLHLYLWGTSMDAPYIHVAAMHWWCFENPIYELWTGSLVYETCHADIALTEYNQYTNTHVFKIQIQMYSKYKYNCIVHANTNQFTICGLGRRFMGPDMLTLPWQKSNGSIRVHKNTNTWKPKEKQLLLQIQLQILFWFLWQHVLPIWFRCNSTFWTETSCSLGMHKKLNQIIYMQIHQNTANTGSV